MKKVALFDLDKTIYNAHSFFQLAEYEVENGRVRQETWLEIQKLLGRYKSGELTYSVTANLLLENFARDLTGQKYADLLNDTNDFFIKNATNFYPYFAQVLPMLRQTHDIYIVTTNAQYVAETIVARFGLTGSISTEFGIERGLFTGQVIKSLANGKSLVADIITKYGKAGSIAVGDSENDIGMLELVEFPVCIHPSDALKQYAENHHWALTDTDQAKVVFENIISRVK